MDIDFSRYRKDDDTDPVDNLQTLKSIGSNGQLFECVFSKKSVFVG